MTMLIHIPHVLGKAELDIMRKQLQVAGDAWVDGRVTAGYQGASVKKNRQIAEDSAVARELGDKVLTALHRNALFISATLPNRIYPPMFNLYEASMHFGDHVDGAIRTVPGSGYKMRTDISATLFLTAPDEYDGGELCINDAYGLHSVKLPAGDLVIYPATSLHHVNPVTRGARLASFFWIQSLIRMDTQRSVLFDLDNAIQKLNASSVDEAIRVLLIGCYHNLLRMWTEM